MTWLSWVKTCRFRNWLSDQSPFPPSDSLRKFGWKVIERWSMCCHFLSLAFLTEITDSDCKQNCNARVRVAYVSSLINRAKKPWYNAQRRTGAESLTATASSEGKYIEDFQVCAFFHWLYSRWWNTKDDACKISMTLWKNVVDFYDITFQWIYSVWQLLMGDACFRWRLLYLFINALHLF